MAVALAVFPLACGRKEVYNRTVNSITQNEQKEAVVNNITANQLKTEGISAIEKHLAIDRELVITVRGKERFVVMEMQQYNYLRECELNDALHEVRADYEAGRFVAESVENHIQRITQ